jgi:UDP-N-acetylmuramate: L-alanyl-gamma-D-glutamyl-meso-diaminopimelate ligase
MSDFLRGLGITINEGYSAANLDSRPDLVVVGNVIRRINPEAVALERSAIPYMSMTTALNEFFIRDKKRIVVAGTHGKTTLSAMIAWILYHEGLDPGFMIGGLPANFRRSHRLGAGLHFVIEGDEYDTAYFDKAPKFLHYHPDVAVITSCEFDHADIYRSVEQIEEQFRTMVTMVPEDGCLVAYGDDARVRDIAASARSRVRMYGIDTAAEWRLHEYEDSGETMRTAVRKGQRQVAAGTIPVVGRHNLLNAIAAIAVAEWVGIDPERAMEALASFRGVRRRQEIRAEIGGITVIDDFAHHPTAVDVTCAAVKERFPHRRLVAVFEPRTNTSKRAFFQQLYVSSFRKADAVFLREPRDVEDIPVAERFNSELLAEALRSGSKDAEAFAETDDLLDSLVLSLIPGDIVLVMSNGSFDNLIDRLLARLKEREP